MNPFSLEGRNILVTGASSGIGRACAVACAEAGARVALVGRNRDRLNETLGLLPEVPGGPHLPICADLTDFDGLRPLVTQAVATLGPLHGLLNAAGVSTTLPLNAATPQRLDDLFRPNVYAAYLLTREVCRKGCYAGGGQTCIVFFSSVMASVGESGKSLYAMTKGALLAGMRSLAVEYAPRGIRVNAVTPGAVLTPMNARLPHMADPEARARLAARHPLGLGTPDDVARACIFLLSDAARWVTGSNLTVDGGYTAM